MKKLLFIFLVSLTGTASAQIRRGHHNTSAPKRPHVYATASANDDTDLPDRNHGTGLRLGTTWASVKAGARGEAPPATFEGGVFHQRALSPRLSVQGEALYYRDVTTFGTDRRISSGFRLPALFVINPFYNVSFHVGPQLQWRTGGSAWQTAPAPTAGEAPGAPTVMLAPRLTGSAVVGAEARLSFLRFGLRYSLPFNELMDLPAAGRHFSNAWSNGQMQAYLGAGF